MKGYYGNSDSHLRGENDLSPQDHSRLGDAFRRVTMIGGEGRVYYTVEHFRFFLLIDKNNLDNKWVFVLSYFTSWMHT